MSTRRCERSSEQEEVAVDCDYIVHTAGSFPQRHAGDLMPAIVGGVRAVIQTAEATQPVRQVVFTDSMYGTKRYVDTWSGSKMSQAAITGQSELALMLTADTTVLNESMIPDKDGPLQR